MNSKFALRMACMVLVPMIAAFYTYSFISRRFLSPADAAATSSQMVIIEPKTTFRAVARNLEKKGLVNDAWALRVIAKLNRGDKKVKAGEYEISAAMLPLDILGKLMRGETYQRKVLVKEGVSVWEIGAIVEEVGLITAEDFERAMSDTTFLESAGIPASTFEGYLFPETYNFTRPIDAQGIIRRMLQEGDNNWTTSYAGRAEAIEMSRHEVLTLASIIQKESAKSEEMPLVSSVFHNRLKKGMKLQADPTVVYAIADFDGTITKAHLQTDSPYNTYVHFGLPPGPICNPGDDAVRAALYPIETDYLYFVADGSGGHVFSTNLDEHNEAVKEYRKQL